MKNTKGLKPNDLLKDSNGNIYKVKAVENDKTLLLVLTYKHRHNKLVDIVGQEWDVREMRTISTKDKLHPNEKMPWLEDLELLKSIEKPTSFRVDMFIHDREGNKYRIIDKGVNFVAEVTYGVTKTVGDKIRFDKNDTNFKPINEKF